jgi:hypothetical protein
MALAAFILAAPGRPTSGFEVFAPILESLLPLPKHHSQSAQDLVKKSTLKSWNGGFK